MAMADSICSVDRCDATATRRGYCTKHYQRWRTHGDVNAYFPNARKACGISGCTRPHYAKGWCKVHYKRHWKNGDPERLLPHFSPLAGRRGDMNPQWRGDSIGYSGTHQRLRKTYGPASNYPCEHCGGESRDWAYTHDDPDERTSPEGLVYSVAGRDFYIPLCDPCHGRFDAAWGQARKSRAKDLHPAATRADAGDIARV